MKRLKSLLSALRTWGKCLRWLGYAILCFVCALVPSSLGVQEKVLCLVGGLFFVLLCVFRYLDLKETRTGYTPRRRLARDR